MIVCVRILLILCLAVQVACSGGAKQSDTPKTITPQNNHAPLNDTGITGYGRTSYYPFDNISTPDPQYPGQDAQYGRDPKTRESGGRNGFSFTKLDSNGQPLADDVNSWACVRDNVTGLIWEAKTTDGSLQDKTATFTWYDPNAGASSNAGTPNGGICFGNISCDTDSYVKSISNKKLCGSSQWRIPNVNELLSIYNYWANPPSWYDIMFFLNRPTQLWSNNTYPTDPTEAWSVFFTWGGFAFGSPKKNALPLMLVSTGDAPVLQAAPGFVDNGDGTVTDEVTGLMVARCVYGNTWDGKTCTGLGSGYNWQTALVGAKTLNEGGGFAGYHDWRVPNIKELAALVNWQSTDMFDPAIFPAIPPYVGYWSSSPDVYTISGAWMIEDTHQMTTINKGLWYNVTFFIRGGDQ